MSPYVFNGPVANPTITTDFVLNWPESEPDVCLVHRDLLVAWVNERAQLRTAFQAIRQALEALA